jgi:hypothetical protein
MALIISLSCTLWHLLAAYTVIIGVKHGRRSIWAHRIIDTKRSWIWREMNKEPWRVTPTVVAIALFALTAGGASGHDPSRPELNGWYESLHSGKGPCCDGSEAKRVDDADWDSKDGHYRVRIDGEWVDVPNDAVVDGPNRAGRTMVWPYYLNGHPKVRCFMLGTMS